MGANSAECKRGLGYGWVGWVAMVVLCAGLLSGAPALFGRDSLVQRKSATRTAGAGEFGALQNNLHGQTALAQALHDGSETSMIGSLLDVVNRDISSRMTGPKDGQSLQSKDLSLYFYCQKYVEAKAEMLAEGKGHYTTERYLNLCHTQDCDMSSRRGTDGLTEFKYMNSDGMFYSEPDQKWCADNADDARCKTCDEVTEPVHPMCSACPVVQVSNLSITGQRLLSKVDGGTMPPAPQAFSTAQVNSNYRVQALAEITSVLNKGLQALGQEPLQVYQYCATFMDMRAEMYRKGRNKRSGRWRGERRTGQELAKCAAQDCSIYTRHHPTFMNEEGMFYHPEGQQSCEANPSDPRYISASARTPARAHRARLLVCTRTHAHTQKSRAQAHTSHGVQLHILI